MEESIFQLLVMNDNQNGDQISRRIIFPFRVQFLIRVTCGLYNVKHKT